jgi:Amt family ammonium transporter
VLYGGLIYSILEITLGLKLSPEEAYNGADLSVHKISATLDREVSW